MKVMPWQLIRNQLPIFWRAKHGVHNDSILHPEWFTILCRFVLVGGNNLRAIVDEFIVHTCF
jgi:hypothetical protein